MCIDSEKYHMLIENLPDAFAYHQVVTDDDGTPVDYIFLEVNAAFEEMTGLKKKMIIGKKVTEVLPGIEKGDFDWIGTYGQVASNGKPNRFESFSEPLCRWYDISAYSDKPGFFATAFRDISIDKKTEQALLDSEEKHRRLFETMAQGVIYQAADGKIISANPAAEKILGLSLEQMRQKTSMDPLWQMIEEDGTAVPGTDHPTMIALRTGQRVGPVTKGIYRPDLDSHIWLSLTAIPLFLPGETNPFQAYATFTDISERNTAEKRLKEEFNLRNALIDNIPNCIALILKKDTRQIVASNKAGQEIGAVPGKTCFQTSALREDPCPFCLASEMWKSGQLQQVEVEYRGAWYEGIWAPLSNDLYVHYIFDITERKQSERKLNKIEWMLSQKETPESIEQAEAYDQGYGDLTELNNGGIILTSIGPELLKSFSNDYMELLGTSSAIYEVNGDYAFGIFASGWCRMMDKASRNLCNTNDNIEALNSCRWLCHESCWTDCSQKAILENRQVDIECNGGIRLYAVPIIASGEVVGAINFGYGDPPEDKEKLRKLANTYQENFDDLVREAQVYETRPPYIIDMAKKRLHATARLIGSMIEKKQAEDVVRNINEKLEERVRERTAQLEAANRELDAFTYSASHDLRGPLNRISGFSEALLEDYAEVLDSQGRDYLQRISKSTQHMGELIDDLLKLSKVSQQQISREPVELSVLANVYLKVLQAMEPERQVEVLIKPGLVAEADTALIRIALDNLLSNAWKYTSGKEKGRIEFGSIVKEGKEVFFIRDNGTGFDMKHYEKLFTAFQRLHDAKAYPGTGVGLSIVSRIIYRHGGEIWAEGEPGKGACFFFTLP